MLEVTGLCVRYPDGTTVGPWSAQFETGLWQLVGPNGAGKSTLLAAVAGALPRHQGQVRHAGGDPDLDASVRARFGYLAPEPALPGFLTVREAWKMAAGLRGRPEWDGASLEAALGLTPDRRASTCSSGMRQKLELIAALAGDPEVLVLDEPFANLDAQSRSWLEDRLRTHPGIVLLAHHGGILGRPVEVG